MRQRQRQRQVSIDLYVTLHLTLQIDPRSIPKFWRFTWRCRLTLCVVTALGSS